MWEGLWALEAGGQGRDEGEKIGRTPPHLYGVCMCVVIRPVTRAAYCSEVLGARFLPFSSGQGAGPIAHLDSITSGRAETSRSEGGLLHVAGSSD